MSKLEQVNKVLELLVKQAAVDGKLVGIGYASFLVALKKEHSQELNDAFYAGADHVFHSIMGMMDDDREPTDDDLEKMAKLQREINLWRIRFAKRFGQ